jgi:hypothetical protein
MTDQEARSAATSWEKLSDGTQARIRTILLFGVVIGFVIGVLAASLWVRFA